jgi:hypothetical protein
MAIIKDGEVWWCESEEYDTYERARGVENPRAQRIAT